MAISINLAVLVVFVLGSILYGSTDAFCCKRYCCKYGWWWGSGSCKRECVRCSDLCAARIGYGKRSDVPKNLAIDPFPCKFDEYDADDSGGITIEEFAKALNAKVGEAQLGEAFQKADINKDGTINCRELSKAPFDFRCKVACPSELLDELGIN